MKPPPGWLLLVAGLYDARFADVLQVWDIVAATTTDRARACRRVVGVLAATDQAKEGTHG